MEENKKGFNTLYLVLGVSTLVVAIIGATFAFFSASQTNNTITGNIAEAGGLVLDVKAITYDPSDETYKTTTGSNIVPLNLITNQTPILGEDGKTVTGYTDPTSQFAKAMAKKCRDDLGNNICEVYKISVSNQSKSAVMQIRGRLNLTSNATNMYWKLIDATTSTVQYTPVDDNPEDDVTPTTVNYEVLETATETTGVLPVRANETVNNYLTITVGNTGTSEDPVYTNTGTNVTLYGTESTEGASSATYYVIVWLEELGREQEEEDASTAELQRVYNGTITFDAVDASGNRSGVTATFLS